MRIEASWQVVLGLLMGASVSLACGGEGSGDDSASTGGSASGGSSASSGGGSATGGDSSSGTGGEPSASGGASSAPPFDCLSDDECGVSFECLSCGLVSDGGWCEQTMPCNFDEDCGIDGKCGYNRASSEYRCLPKSYCE